MVKWILFIIGCVLVVVIGMGADSKKESEDD